MSEREYKSLHFLVRSTIAEVNAFTIMIWINLTFIHAQNKTFILILAKVELHKGIQ